MYQFSLTRFMGGRISMNSPISRPYNVSPTFANMTVQRQRLVLREDVNLAQVRVHAIGERDVDDAIDAAEGYGRFGTVTGEGIKALSCAAGQQDSQSISH